MPRRAAHAGGNPETGHLETVLTEASREAGGALGQLNLALSARRGVTPGRLQEWAATLRRAADMVDGLVPRQGEMSV